jgi:hypothetical protein
MSEEKTGISYDRLVEIATRLKDLLKEDYAASEIIYNLNFSYDLDLTEEEINFIGFYEDDTFSEEDENDYLED